MRPLSARTLLAHAQAARDNLRQRGLAVLFVPLLLLNVFALFVKHNDYPLLAPETIICGIGLTLAGATVGIAAALLGRYLGGMILGTIVTLIVDFQTQLFTPSWALVGTIWLLATSAVIYFDRFLMRALPTVAAVMLGTVAIIPSQPLNTWPPKVDSTPLNDLPPIIHLVLDEHIALEGIPRELDQGARTFRLIHDFHERFGFHLFTRAVSRYYNSYNSIPSVLNFTTTEVNEGFFGGSFRQGHTPRENAYFAEMKRRGYRIQVLQSDYIDYCGTPQDGLVDACITYANEGLQALEHEQLALRRRVQMMISMFTRLSYLSSGVRYNTRANRLLGLGTSRVSIFSSMQALDSFMAQVSEPSVGTLYFSHIIAPHYPYAFMSDCTIRGDAMSWLNAGGAARPRRNTAESRAVRYPLYLEQLSCVYRKLEELLVHLDATGWLDQSIIVIHSDHGSRISQWPAAAEHLERFTDQDFTDVFATHFAYRFPGSIAKVDRRMLALDDLLRSVVEQGRVPEVLSAQEAPEVYFFSDATGLGPQRRTMPDFGWVDSIEP